LRARDSTITRPREGDQWAAPLRLQRPEVFATRATDQRVMREILPTLRAAFTRDRNPLLTAVRWSGWRFHTVIPLILTSCSSFRLSSEIIEERGLVDAFSIFPAM
jgi:hypothetical protein